MSDREPSVSASAKSAADWALESLRCEAQCWRDTGHPSLFAEFLLRNGRPFDGVDHVSSSGARRQCFMNAITYADKFGLRYVEGDCFVNGSMAVHHAWCADGPMALETTLPKSQNQRLLYFGVEFSARDAFKLMETNRVYGLFAPDQVWNRALMHQIDPALPVLAGLTAK